jgi:cysteinyl-tRNA synthetase
MKLYNTQTREIEEITGKSIKMYACGPTVYDRAHIGNLRTYINIDVLRRSLRYLGYEVKHVMNITDIEDKIIKKSHEQGLECHQITSVCEKSFWQDLDELNIEKPDASPHATDPKVIKEMVKIIETLIDKGYAYVANDDSIYFEVEKWPDYGKLSHLDKKGIRPGARVAQDEYDKENPQDFALWKAAKEGEPSWDGPAGIKGRPGWHIECSAMSMLYLGETLDIHAGAVDLIFPHHENEIAQSEAYSGKPFVKHWFHGEHLLVEGKKMSKSLGNLYSLDELVSEYKVEPLALRMLCLQSSWRDKLNFTGRSIQDAQNTLNNLRNFLTRISQTTGGDKTEKLVQKADKSFKNALEDDLNLPIAMAAVFDLISEVNKLDSPEPVPILDFFSRVDEVLALNLSPEKAEAEVEKLFKEYQEARVKKDWAKSDELRQKISDRGWLAEDTKCDSILRKK